MHKMAKLFDITRTIQKAPLYPGSEPFQVQPLTTITESEDFNISMLQGDSHLGTHVDAPRHALAQGMTIEQIDLSVYYGTCYVLEIPQNTIVSTQFFQQYLPKCTRLLLKSNGTSFLSLQAAEYLASQKLVLLGTDHLSPAPLNCEGPIHRLFLQQHTVLLENLWLEQVPEGFYTLCAFPLKIEGGDGSPVRAVLLSDEH